MVSFDYYRDEYGGNAVPESRFAYYERKAAAFVNTATFGRAEGNIIAPVQNAVCDVAERLYIGDESKAGSGISSEKVGDYSVSYSEFAALSAPDQLKSIVKQWLADTGLLYRGCGDDNE